MAGPAEALRERARARGLSLLEDEPWAPISDRAALLLVDPADPEWATAAEPVTLWLLVEREVARGLPRPQREPLQRDGVLIEHHRGQQHPATELVVLTLEDATEVIEGTSRRSLEARWSVAHSEPLHDRLRRQEQLAAAAAALPEEAVERIVRPLFLQAVSAIGALRAFETGGEASLLAAAGDAAASLARLACILDEGSHPPPRHLLLAARGTRRGQRLAVWLDDLVPALSGDAAAGRRVAGSRDQVIEETARLVGQDMRDRPWLRDPASYALRSPR
jgi:hypothetical protein